MTTIDFEYLPPLAEDTFKLATRKEQICVKTLAPKDTLLPEDLHFEVRWSPANGASPALDIASRHTLPCT